MAGGGGGSDGDVGFQIAPMIDLILVLMVFFMSTVAMKEVENELGIGLPGRSASVPDTDAGKNTEVSIGIDIDGTVSVNSEVLGEAADRELEKLKSMLKEQLVLFGEKTPVVIVPKPEVLHQRVVDVLNACSAADVKNISFGG